MSERDEDTGYVVKDRRRFDEHGRRPDVTGTVADTGTATEAGTAPEVTSDASSRPDDDADLALEMGSEGSVTFSDFVLSLATNAIIHLGGEAKDERIPGRVNLSVAAQHIDIIAMLGVKTKGNLEAEERELLDAVLYDLRMRYVAVAQQGKREG